MWHEYIKYFSKAKNASNNAIKLTVPVEAYQKTIGVFAYSRIFQVFLSSIIIVDISEYKKEKAGKPIHKKLLFAWERICLYFFKRILL